MLTNEVVRQFATDIEAHRTAILTLKRCTHGLIAGNILLCAAILLVGAELYLIEKDGRNRDKE